jgi:hypothetical protein
MRSFKGQAMKEDEHHAKPDGEIPSRVIDSRSGFHDAIREAFASLAASASHEVVICDTDFADWPLGEISVIDSLTHWVRPQRKLTLYAQTFDEVLRRHSRWVTWRRQFAHAVECRVVEPLEQGRMPLLFSASEGATLRMFDATRYRGALSADARDAVLAREQIDAISQRSAEGFPATTLGL